MNEARDMYFSDANIAEKNLKVKIYMLTKIKEISSIVANISQVILVCVAVFGYFYTVVPVYQKEQLAESVAEQQKIISVIEQKNSSIEQEILENNMVLERQKKIIVERQDEIEGLKKTVSVLKSEFESLNLNNESLEKKINALSLEKISKERALEQMQAKLVTSYRSIFIENMVGYSMIRALREYISGEKNFTIKSVDDIKRYKNALVSPYIIIERCIEDYSHNYLEVYSLVPTLEKKRLANEFRIKLSKRQDLKSPFFDEKAINEVINDMSKKLTSMPSNMPEWEKSQQKKVLEYEWDKKILEILFAFRGKDFDKISKFWTNQ